MRDEAAMLQQSRCAPALALLLGAMAWGQPAAADPREPCVIPAGTTAFEFDSQNNKLKGLIDLPRSTGKHPAILMVLGGADSDVTVDHYYDELRSAFRECGIATVLWDKAGNGCSSGSYSSPLPLHDRTAETMAALEELKRRQDIDTSRIGLWALSQGGIVAPMVAVRSTDIAYLIVVNGLGSDALGQGAYLSVRLLRDAGVDEADAREAYETLRRSVAVMRAGGTDEEALSVTAGLQKYPALLSMYRLDEAGSKELRVLLKDPQWSLSAGEFIRHVGRPTLALFGTRDDVADWREGMQVYREAFATQRKGYLTMKLFDDADHEMRPGRVKPGQKSIFVRGYVDTMARWLKSRGFANAG